MNETLAIIARYLKKDTIAVKDGKLEITDKEDKKLRKLLGDGYDKSIEAAIKPSEENETEDEKKAALELKAITAQLNTPPAPPANSPPNDPPANNPPADPPANSPIDPVAAIKELQDKLIILEAKQEPDKPDKTNIPTKVIQLTGAHSKAHIYGLQADFYARGKWWNEITASRIIPTRRRSKGEFVAFQDEFDNYGEQLSARMNELHASGLSGLKGKELFAAIDYSAFTGTGWGNEYVVRRMDALVSYVRELPSVSAIFPVRYGVQNKDIMTNSFMEDFSQAYQSGEVFKGGYKLIPEEAKVDDVMFKHQFSELKKLEKEYLGYLNREGSDPMKWNFIEWLMIETIKKLHNEREVRRVKGVRIDPIAGTAGHFMFGSDGVIKRLRTYKERFQVNPFETLSIYTSSTMLSYIENMVSLVNGIIPSLRGYVLYVNEKHIPWYKALYRTKYGTDLDFKGSMLEVMDYSIDGIIPVPGMGNSYEMFICPIGNIELQENEVGEMGKIYFERRLENLITAAWWMEGTGAFMVGKKYANAAALIASARREQWIFINDPYNVLADGATTADGSKNDRHKTVENTGATDITDITNKEEGVVYRVECGHTTNASTITKAALFSNLVSTWTPTAVGDYLEFWWNATTSKFVEVRRQVT